MVMKESHGGGGVIPLSRKRDRGSATWTYFALHIYVRMAFGLFDTLYGLEV